MYLTSAAVSEDADKNWSITNNNITGSAYGIRWFAATTAAESMTGVVVRHNSIAGNTVAGTGTPPFADVYSATTKTLSAPDNWLGQASGPAAGQVSGPVSTEPWLPSDSQDPVKAGDSGFWPMTTSPPVVSTPVASGRSIALLLTVGTGLRPCS